MGSPVGKVQCSGDPEDFKFLCAVEEMKMEWAHWEILEPVSIYSFDFLFLV